MISPDHAYNALPALHRVSLRPVERALNGRCPLSLASLGNSPSRRECPGVGSQCPGVVHDVQGVVHLLHQVVQHVHQGLSLKFEETRLRGGLSLPLTPLVAMVRAWRRGQALGPLPSMVSITSGKSFRWRCRQLPVAYRKILPVVAMGKPENLSGMPSFRGPNLRRLCNIGSIRHHRQRPRRGRGSEEGREEEGREGRGEGICGTEMAETLTP